MDSFLFILIRIVIFGTLLACIVLSQRFWFRKASGLIGRVHHPLWRPLWRSLWTVALGLVLLPAVLWLVGARGLFFPRSAYALLGLWLTSALLAYVGIQVVHAGEWLWRRLATRRPQAGQGRLEDPTRRYFFQTASTLAGAVPFVGVLYGFVAGRLHYTVERVEVPLANLPEGLDGLRIAQLSDIHIGAYMPHEQVRRAVAMANELGAHLAVVTGDLVTASRDPLEACVKELAALRAPLGVWGCLGNHEIYADCEDEATELLRRVGVRILRRQNAEIAWRGAKLNLIGVDYQRQLASSGRRLTMLRGVEPLVRRDAPNILLSHNPNAFYRAAELGIELTLAGHTHGGQVQVEILDQRLSPARFFTEFIAGLYQRQVASGPWLTARAGAARDGIRGELPTASLYVNRGLGTVGAPVRLGSPPEITLLTLRRA